MRYLTLGVALALAGCAATTYEVAVMPRDSGRIYTGSAGNVGGREGPISITIENKAYAGTGGGFVSMDNPNGGLAKALLQAPDGSGLRCDLRGSPGGGSGVCRDDAGREYDVQLRPVAPK